MRISIPEYGRIPRASISPSALHRLQAFDEKYAASNNRCIFDWSHRHEIRAQNYVGVIQVQGLVIEILPKIDSAQQTTAAHFDRNEFDSVRAQHNLLYMLSFTKKIPVRERDLAALRLQKMPLLEALVSIFVEQLLGEIRKGLEHSYIYKEENAKFLKGKFLLNQNLLKNSVHKERVFIGYDNFISDTWLNRILKAACTRLLQMVSTVRNQKRLREAILYFADITDCQIKDYHFKKVHLSKNTARFRNLFEFSRIVLTRSAPGPSFGTIKTFSLLFPMEILFEEFVARFVRKYCGELGLTRKDIHVQALQRRKWLLRRPDNSGAFRLRPDIVIDGDCGTVKTILDTKWKHLKSDQEDSKNGVSQADLYQLYAYAQRYNSYDNILLYPLVHRLAPKEYRLDGDENKKVRIEFVDLNRDLYKQRSALIADLKTVFRFDK